MMIVVITFLFGFRIRPIKEKEEACLLKLLSLNIINLLKYHIHGFNKCVGEKNQGYYDTENYIQADKYLHTVETSEFFLWILECVGRN